MRDLVSDAGDMLVGCIEFRGGVEDDKMYLQEPLKEGDLGQLSKLCELCALELALQAGGESLRGESVHWVGDSQSGVNILMVGSKKPRCHAVAVRIWHLAHSFDIRLSCAWMPHTSPEIQVAVNLSKNFDFSEYKLSPGDFVQVHQRFGPLCLDLFASPFSHLLKYFCLRYLYKDTVAVDSFTANWGGLTNGFFHPPVCQITRA